MCMNIVDVKPTYQHNDFPQTRRHDADETDESFPVCSGTYIHIYLIITYSKINLLKNARAADIHTGRHLSKG